ncbi:hypothetical protein AB1Y20_010054 [Prymnesium parvum]|uniref:t-SNARE coiled-coil homology domain-containing protein n=1 Tax=Prymnesium parvum TaxID=97485 RepID=A0AB34K767_PRYPA
MRAADPAPFATTANQPLVPSANLTSVKKQLKQDLKEIRGAVDSLGKLSRKRGRDTGPQVLHLSEQVRRRARSTTAMLRDAMSSTTEGSADYEALAKLGEELKTVLREFQRSVEAASAASEAGPSSSCTALVAAAPQSVALEIDGRGTAVGEGHGQIQQQVMHQDFATQEQLQAVATNDRVIAEREVGIEGIAKSVQELHEIFEDINALVMEQGVHIDNIQTNIEKASSHQARAVNELVSASRHQRRSRKVMCWVIVLVILLMVILLVVLKFGSHSLR